MLRFCPKFFVLYASIYGTSKMTYIIIYLIFGSKYVHLNPHCGKEMIRNNSSSLRSQIEFVFFFSFSDLTSRRCWNKGKLLRQSKCFHAQIKYKVKYKSLAIAIKRVFYIENNVAILTSFTAPIGVLPKKVYSSFSNNKHLVVLFSRSAKQT